MSYLSSDVRARNNLTVSCLTTVKTLIAEGRRIVGVSAQRENEEVEFFAREVILSAGAVFSPAILLRSGIGPAVELSELGLDVLSDLRGVGRNLQNHPALYVAGRLHPGSRQSDSLRTHPTAGIRRSSGLRGCPSTDTYINIQSKSSWNDVGKQIANLSPVLLKPASRGQLTLVSPCEYPLVEFNFLDDERDLLRLMDLFTMTVDIMTSKHVRPLLAGEPFPVRYMDRLRRLNERTPSNMRQSRMIAKALDLMPESLAYRLLMTLAGGRVDLRELVTDRRVLAELIKQNISGSFHLVGTCRMGRLSDDGVVDCAGRVHGVTGLRVADASIMPSIPRGNTNIPTMMVAEKIADTIRASAH